jgi:transcriptional regulator with XRE-family HTH domain
VAIAGAQGGMVKKSRWFFGTAIEWCSIRGGAPRARRDGKLQGQELNITLNDELRSFVDPLSDIEYEALERSLLAEGCRDALVLWNDILIDGHNRYAICQKHGIEYRTVQNNSFTSLDDVKLWMIDNHLARRSVSDFQRGLLALRKKQIVAARRVGQAPAESEAAADAAPPPWNTREEVARAARVSPNTISQIERIQKTATPQLLDAVRTGAISINAAANVAQLPEPVQRAAVAGGRKELQQAARQVREQKAASRPRKEPQEGEPVDEAARMRAEIAALKDRVATLLTENEVLKQRLAALSGEGAR